MGHTKLTNWIHGLQLDVKGLLWFSALFMVFRIAFIALFQDQLGEVSLGDILEALWLGFRISLKTAGAIVLLSFYFPRYPVFYVEKGVNGIHLGQYVDGCMELVLLYLHFYFAYVFLTLQSSMLALML
ncbi:hypothetical protein [Veillonella sp. oral taxon 780]|uniref:hypothetical protein n=1 Tax=Veillonella sp. oral taxon 780 TaxID=671229 RepID=UPI0008FF6DE7